MTPRWRRIAPDAAERVHGRVPGVNREELVRLTARREGIPESDVDAVLGGLLDSIVLSLSAGHAVNLRRFGVLEPRRRKPTRKMVPGKGVVELPARLSVGFRASTRLLERLNDARTPH